MRRSILLFALLAAACDDGFDDGYDGSGNGNEIVFGITQDANGVTSDYDFIGLDGHGGSRAAAFRDGDGRGSCWFENLDDRLGKPHVDTGSARWTGGGLPADGLLVLANQPDPTKLAAHWTSSDILSFYGEGFAMPPLDLVSMRAPLVELTVGAITPAPDTTSKTLAIKPTTDVSVSWTPPASETLSRVVVTLETDHANVRCFDFADTGSIIVPARWIAQLFPTGAAGADAGTSSTGITGHFTIATQRQTTLLEPGDWIVYVVAESMQRDIAFTGTRD